MPVECSENPLIFSQADLLQAAKTLQKNKAPGSDGILTEIILLSLFADESKCLFFQVSGNTPIVQHRLDLSINMFGVLSA